MEKIITFLFIIFSFTLNAQSYIERLTEAKVIQKNVCPEESFYRPYLCKFPDTDTVYVKFNENKDLVNLDTLKKDIFKGIEETFSFVNKVLVERDFFPNVIVDFKYMDGFSGTLAKAEVPHCVDGLPQTMTFDIYDLPIDSVIYSTLPDSVKLKIGTPKDILTISYHEALHLLGISHEEWEGSIMYHSYRGKRYFSAYDIIQLRLHYKIYEPFYFKDICFIPVNKSNSLSLTKNFKEYEFVSKCDDININYIDYNIILALQEIRSFIEKAIKTNSSFRDLDCNSLVGGSLNSLHITSQAIDFSCINKAYNHVIAEEITNNNVLRLKLEKLGVKTFGFYNGHIHIDTRKTERTIIFDKRNELSTSNHSCDL